VSLLFGFCEMAEPILSNRARECSALLFTDISGTHETEKENIM
jgi:hypothetical protein